MFIHIDLINAVLYKTCYLIDFGLSYSVGISS